MCKIDPHIGEVWWHRKKMKTKKSSLTKTNLFDFSCKKPNMYFLWICLFLNMLINVF